MSKHALEVSGCWLLRHAQPRIAEGICYGQLDAAADSAATQQAAQACARFLAGHVPQHARITVLHSPLQRCTQLAHALASQPAARQRIGDLLSEPRLMEVHFGAWEGLPWNQIAAAEWTAWTADFAHHRPGQHGESLADLMARVQDLLDDRDHHGPWQVWVTHAGVMRTVELLSRGLRAQDLTTPQLWPRQVCGYGQWMPLPAMPARQVAQCAAEAP